MNLRGGGWTIIQRRVNNSINFTRNWKSYKDGFGRFDSSFWLGLDKINEITNSELYELYIGLQNFAGDVRSAWYNSISISDENDDYKITLGPYDSIRSDAGDSFGTHSGAGFSTYDNDNDQYSQLHCAQYFSSGWWFTTSCHDAHLNGVYYTSASGGPSAGHGVIWQGWTGDTESLKTTLMAIRPV